VRRGEVPSQVVRWMDEEGVSVTDEPVIVEVVMPGARGGGRFDTGPVGVRCGAREVWAYRAIGAAAVRVEAGRKARHFYVPSLR
jgi:hypothetical protein